MKNFERIDTPITGIDTKRIIKDGRVYEAVTYFPPDPRQFVDNEIAKIQAGMDTEDQRSAVSRMLRPVLERAAGLTE